MMSEKPPSPQFQLASILEKTLVFMGDVLSNVNRLDRRYKDLQADRATLLFLGQNSAWITGIESLIPVIAQWRDLIQENMAAIVVPDASVTTIRKLTRPSSLLRTTVISHFSSCI